jgi:hypothetical protein
LQTAISKRLSLLRVAVCCTVLRFRWCQSGINSAFVSTFPDVGKIFGTGQVGPVYPPPRKVEYQAGQQPGEALVEVSDGLGAKQVVEEQKALEAVGVSSILKTLCMLTFTLTSIANFSETGRYPTHPPADNCQS